MELLSVALAILAIVVVVEFFHIGYLAARVRENTGIISMQLDQLLKAQGVKDPIGDRRVAFARWKP